MRLETAPTGDGGKYRITDLFSETSFSLRANHPDSIGMVQKPPLDASPAKRAWIWLSKPSGEWLVIIYLTEH